MITTARAAKWLQSLPDDDAAALLDAVARCAADPDTHGPRCKKLGAGLWEARINCQGHRVYRAMFGFRASEPVVLSTCMKTSETVHQKAIDEARQTLTTAVPLQGAAMPKELPIFTLESGWLYSSDGRQLRVRHHTRKKIIVQTDTGPVTLSRSRLEGNGFDVVDGVTYSLTRYVLPHELGEIA